MEVKKHIRNDHKQEKSHRDDFCPFFKERIYRARFVLGQVCV